MDSVEVSVRNLVSSIGGVPQDASASADLYLELGMASFHALQLLTELEEQFNIQIPDDQFVEATTIARLTDVVKGLVVSA